MSHTLTLSLRAREGKDKKGILSLICGVEYSIFVKSRHHDVQSFCLFTPLLRQSFCLFTPLLRQSFCFFTPQKTVHGDLKNGPPQQQQQQQQQERFPLTDLSAAPQIKRGSAAVIQFRRPSSPERRNFRPKKAYVRMCWHEALEE